MISVAFLVVVMSADMSGYPDSHLSASRSGSRSRRILLASILVVLVMGWLAYVWFITGVFPVTERYPSGAIKAKGFVRRAGVEEYKPQGQWVTYYENGQKESEGPYEGGQKTGEWQYWDELGHQTSATTSPAHRGRE